MNNKIGGDFSEIYNEGIHLQEITRPWKDIAASIDNLRTVRQENLIKLYYYKNKNHYYTYFENWIGYARKGFDNIPKLTGLNKYPDFSKLYDLIWKSIEDSFNDLHSRTVIDLNASYKDFESIKSLDLEGVKSFVSHYNKWACETISKTGGITFDSTKEKVRELLNLWKKVAYNLYFIVFSITI